MPRKLRTQWFGLAPDSETQGAPDKWDGRSAVGVTKTGLTDLAQCVTLAWAVLTAELLLMIYMRSSRLLTRTPQPCWPTRRYIQVLGAQLMRSSVRASFDK
jgi:hypothetical protein